MISNQYKCVYIHIPKTAGTSIENVLRNNGSIIVGGTDHRTLQQYYDEDFIDSSYFKFTIVRNTFDRVYSLYAYMKAGDNGSTAGKNLQSMMPETFKEFCYEFIKDGPRVDKIGKLTSQLNYITINNKIHMDYIGRFENLKESYDYIKNKLGLIMELPHTRINKHDHYILHYTDELYDIVENAYKDEIKEFNFKRGR